MISREKALRIACDWIDAWNRHDIDAIMSHYSDDVELVSPNVIMLLEYESGQVKGKDTLREYFKKGLSAFPDLRFEMIEVFTGVDSFVLYYRRHNGPLGAEIMELDDEEKIRKVVAHYDH